MASQLRRVSGIKRRLPSGNAALQAKIAMLPAKLRGQQDRRMLADQKKMQKKNIAMAKDAAVQRKREQESAMGLEAGKLGVNLAMSDMAKTSLGDITRGTKNLWSKEKTAAPAGGDTGIKSWKPGTALSSGLAGYGASKLLGGKSKTKKGLIGAATGGLLGMLSGQGMGGGLTGLVSGGLGGLFS